MKIYHNPRCSKSRQTLQLIRDAGIEPEVVEYLKTPPTAAELRELLSILKCDADAIVRKKEDAYKERFAGHSPSADELIEAVAAHPVLLERPIVVKGKQGVIGRPPENVSALL